MKKWILSIFLVFSLVLSLILPNFIIEGTENTIYVQNFETGTELDILSSLKKYFYLEREDRWNNWDSGGFRIVDEGTNKYLEMGWIDGRLLRGNSNLNLGQTFEFSGRFKGSYNEAAPHGGGFVFIRTTITPYKNDSKPIHEYESDSFHDGVYANGVGATGVYIKPHAHKLQIGIKTSEEKNETSGIGRKYIEVNMPGNKNTVLNFFDLDVVDDGHKIKIFVDQTLMAVIEYGSPVDGIYTYAKLLDGNGDVQFEVTNARIAKDDSTIAMSVRSGTLSIDDLFYTNSSDDGPFISLSKDTMFQTEDIIVTYAKVSSGSWYALMPKNHVANKNMALAWNDIEGVGTVRVLEDRQGGLMIGDLEEGVYDLVFMTDYTEIKRVSITVNYVDPFPLDFSWVFDNPESVNNFGTKNKIAGVEYTEGTKSIKFVFGPEENNKVVDPHIYFNLPDPNMLADDYPIISLLIRKSEGSPNYGDLYYRTDGSSGSWKKETIYYENTTDWQIVTVDMSKIPEWKGTILHFRLDPFAECKKDDVYEIKYVASFSTVDAANNFDGNFYGPTKLSLKTNVITQAGNLDISFNGTVQGDWIGIIPKDGEAVKENALAWANVEQNGEIKLPLEKDGGFQTGHFTPGEYDVVICGSDNKIRQRETFSVVYTDLRPSEVYWDFKHSSTIGRTSGLKNMEISFDPLIKAAKITFFAESGATVSDPYFTLRIEKDTNVSLDEYKIVSLFVRRSSSTPLKGQLYFSTPASGYAGVSSKPINYKSTTDWQLITIDMSDISEWSGNLSTLRIDPFDSCETSDVLEIKYVALFKTIDAALAFEGEFKYSNLIKVANNGNGTVIGGGLYTHGTAFELYAKPSEGYAFGGWYDNETGKVISISRNYTGSATSNMDITARFFSIGDKNGIAFETLGAQMRINEPQGLRFITQINKGSIPADAVNVSYGTLVTLRRNLDALSLKNEDLVLGAAGFKYLNIPAERILVDDEEYQWFTAVIINIPENEYDSVFVARSYVRYTDKENVTHVVYDSAVERSVNIVKTGLGISDDFDENNIVLSFGAVSDTHIGREGQMDKLRTAMNILNARTDFGLDAFLIVGDITDMAGHLLDDTEIKLFKQVIEEGRGIETSILYVLGNHDLKKGGDPTIMSTMFYETLGEDFYDADVNDVDEIIAGRRHWLVNGYHFLGVDFDWDADDYVGEHILWLDSELQAITEEEPNKPVFVAVHFPSSANLDKVLSKYPQVICFTGHVHRPLNSDSAIRQRDYTNLDCGGLYYYIAPKIDGMDQANLGDIYNFAQGYLIEVDINNNVRVRRQNFMNDSEYEPVWYVPAPREDRTHLLYTQDKVEFEKPRFDEEEITITSETSDVITGKFRSAKNGSSPVEYYIVTLYQIVDGVIEKEVMCLSSQYAIHSMDDMPDEIEFGFERKADDYAITVVAYDCHSQSQTIYYSKGMYVVDVDSYTDVYLNGRLTNAGIFMPGETVLIEIDIAPGVHYDLLANNVLLSHDTFIMPEEDVFVKVQAG